MQSYEQRGGEQAGVIMAASGLGMVAVLFATQYASVSSLSSGGALVLPDLQSRAFASVAAPTFALVLAAIAISLAGAFRILSSWKSVEGNSLAQRVKRSVSAALQERRRVFWAALSLYAIVFLFASSTVVYVDSISQRYGAAIPSYHIIGCCGQPGTFPVLTVYLSDNFGLLVIPANMILLAFLPLLVGINAAVFARRAGRGLGMSFCGLSAGVMAGCPVCAGSILFSLLGGGTAVTGAALAGYQPAFTIASVGALIAAPVIAEAR